MPEVTNRCYYSTTNGVGVIGHWITEDGQTLGEISVLTATTMLRFSSSMVMSREGLSGYAAPEYLARHASKFVARDDGYRA